MKYWEIIADNLHAAGWSWGMVTTISTDGETMFLVDAHRGDGRHFIVRADELLTAFIELKRATQVRFQKHQQSKSTRR